MGELYAYDGTTHLTTIRENSTSFTTRAELGQPGSGSFTIEDTAGTIRIVGQKDFLHTESSCSFTRTFRGFIADRTYGRETGEGGPQYVGAGRNIAVELEDLNSMLGFRGITGSDRKRPSETVAERGAWLMASDYVDGLFVDNGRCDFSSDKGMDAADYTDQFPGDVLADMALAQGGVNYHVNDWGSGPELTFRDDNASTDDTCTLRISNVLSDASGVTLNPSHDATMVVSPSRVKSKLSYQYAKGRVVEERAQTATDFNGERFGVASNSNVKTSAKASDEAQVQLWQLHTEEVHVECYVECTSAQVNLILAGMRIQAKFSHLPDYGYDSFTWFRIMERTVEPIVADALIYRLTLRLSPQEAAPPAPGDCTDIYPNTPSDVYYALGGSGNVPNVSDGVVFYWRAGLEYPGPLDAGLQGAWHFGLWGAGGAGTSDYAGDCAQNRLVFVLVGNGTAEIQTSAYPTGSRGLTVKQNGTTIQTGSSGDTFTVVIDDRTDGDCVTVIEITDTGLVCGGKWGFTQLDWTAA